ncbi:MAG: hypothetical protein A2836_00790 [Candidatus Taylorbacteria bacterium RIFCSPHIGHO2_01_FULL_45_63]|uniref:Membrane insertase YidC/Oxa/ALB C-terminal domain-containing protein n=1 Tax=Candidatus Taylorbacteria bacterium RIFCSPHIGHO2_02_FULL_45_35 TaxID=1802311 RepID=A0A1G2MTV7_9BACT|nr:MAG: hypothetical protein A2836_00790 [Candidatus Taylorbacteria bacterium RIFCSPHIGHO2_01_FULL_45_63]OHA27154.1 MAG: hypothetical protein A3D56_03490 [Candidatus Taylorbacteria bacterium RIFCSPHIGHO2_02_FULL_45_35]OHA33854.1 MAG: hypothetical protein A3A22_01465 [Candidatus Taylorbacteria bacterium RIFCSPLOWO2_01_FULL_45_34b]
MGGPGIFHSFFVTPLYNGLIFLMDVLPWPDAGLAIVLLTILVKLVLFPLSRKAIHTQVRMKEIEGELQSVKEKYKDNKQKQAEETMALYKKKGVNPFSSFFLIIIQLPIIFALYRIFLGSQLPEVDQNLLYSFVSVPTNVSVLFLGLIPITGKSLILSLATGISQFFQARLSLGSVAVSPKDAGTFKYDFAKSMNTQMKYVFPVIAFFVAYSISGAVALYWTTSNLFTLGQELFVRHKLKKQKTIFGKIGI